MWAALGRSLIGPASALLSAVLLGWLRECHRR